MLVLANGLEKLLDEGVKYVGDIRDNSKVMYDNYLYIVNNAQEKPTYEQVYAEALKCYRKEIAEAIDLKTTEKIVNEFVFSEDPYGIKCKADLAWQFNVQTLYSMRNNLTFPYMLKVNSDDSGMPLYITLQDIAMFDKLFVELFTHITTWLQSGWVEKTTIANMTEAELDGYKDLR